MLVEVWKTFTRVKSEAQPKNALVTPPQIWKQMKEIIERRQGNFLQFSSVGVLNCTFVTIL
jgi:hypothetical protein